MSTDREVLRQALRHDLLSFVQRTVQTVAPGRDYQHNWHIEAICYQLERCFLGLNRRLIITVPPRYLKSICASVAFPAWVLGRKPSTRLINVSYSNELTAELSRQFRLVANADWYRWAFPEVRVTKSTEAEFVTDMNGSRYATSVGGTLTGRGGNFIIIDDPMKPEEALSKAARESVNSWYRTTLATRLDNKKEDVIILIMQRLHVDDLVGHILESDPNGWVQLDLPVIAQEGSERIQIGDSDWHSRKQGDLLFPEREDQRVLDGQKLSMGSAAFSAQYLQRPLPEQGNLIKHPWFRTYDAPPVPGPDDLIVQSWDTAMKPAEQNDPSVCTTWLVRKSDYFLLDVTCKRVDFPELKKLVVALWQRYTPNTVLIEDKGSGIGLIQELSGGGGLRPIPIDPKGDKAMRLYVQAGKIEAGQVHLPREAPWLAEFLAEVLAFPQGRHDDQVDSLSQFLQWIGERKPPCFSVDWGPDEPPAVLDAWRHLTAPSWP